MKHRSSASRTDEKVEPNGRARKRRQSGGKDPADRSIRDVARLERAAFRARSHADQIADAITRRAGSGTAIVLHIIWFALWIIVNVPTLSGLTPFDPYPFSLLTTIVSLEAIFLSLFVLVSQNRMSHQADQRAELDLQVNLLAERETTMILRLLHDISSHLGLKGVSSKELEDLLKETRVDELYRKLEKALPTEQ